MSAYKYLQELYKNKQSDVMRFLLRVRCWEYKQLGEVVRVENPTRPDKAHLLGYKTKQGYCIYRACVKRGGRRFKNEDRKNGKPINHGVKKRKGGENLRTLAEKKVGKHCANMRVLNSYWVAEDIHNRYYEVILVDPAHNAIRNSPEENWICAAKMKHREARGLTSAGRKARGIAKTTRDHNTIGGSRKACWKRRNTVRLVRS
ncbi:MAG: 60S ribosomal protein L15 [Amphiamblys sp. WSBS2006]|nr:MAG: 60S ribosomal protein L15 [Amphiamblys sp. WSBS2006]